MVRETLEERKKLENEVSVNSTFRIRDPVNYVAGHDGERKILNSRSGCEKYLSGPLAKPLLLTLPTNC